MAHNRKFVPGIVALVKERLKNEHHIIGIQDEIEKIIIDSHFLDNAPFKWVGLMYRYGLKNKLKPEYDRIDKKDGELPIAVELNTRILQWADDHDLQLFKDIFMIAALETLLDVGKQYNLPIDLIKQEREKYGDIPSAIEELELRKLIRDTGEVYVTEIIEDFNNEREARAYATQLIREMRQIDPHALPLNKNDHRKKND